MKRLALILFFIAGVNAFAQVTDSTLYQWIPKGIASLNIAQVALENWTQGGESSLSFTGVGNFGLYYGTENWRFSNDLKLTYGQTKQGDKGFRTNENELYLESVLSRKINWPVDPYISNTVRTALTNGYAYDTDSGDVQIAGFFDPGYITQSVGFALSKSNIIKTRLGVAFQETFANQFTFVTDDPKTTELEKFKFDTGIESVTDVDYPFMENMVYKSKLRLFSRFSSVDVWDVRWDNIITAKVNDLIVVNFNFLLIYERSQSVKTQMKEALQVGITYTLF